MVTTPAFGYGVWAFADLLKLITKGVGKRKGGLETDMSPKEEAAPSAKKEAPLFADTLKRSNARSRTWQGSGGSAIPPPCQGFRSTKQEGVR